MLTDFELGWLVGILEGEGTFRCQARTCHVVVKMTDEDTMLRLANLYEKILGKKFRLSSYDRAHENRKEIYQINLTGSNARTVMRLVVSHMGQRRRARIWQSLNGYVAPKIRLDITKIVMGLSVHQ